MMIRSKYYKSRWELQYKYALANPPCPLLSNRSYFPYPKARDPPYRGGGRGVTIQLAIQPDHSENQFLPVLIPYMVSLPAHQIS